MPRAAYDRVLLGHGSGGRLTAELVRDIFLAGYGNPVLGALEDQATIHLDDAPESLRAARSVVDHRRRIAVTTDSFVVRPLFFPGGDIGRLAVCGTINDLAVGGAEPMCITAAFILEEGLPLETLARVVTSMHRTCLEAGVSIVAGDTKVVERGKGDGIFITTTGIGTLPADQHPLSIAGAVPGDRIIVSGPIGDHGIAIMSAREGLEFETELQSDCAPLNGLARTALASCPPGAIRAMRDPTRGGLAGAVNELAQASGVGVELEEAAIPIRSEVHAACEMLGLEPLYVACEGRLIAVVGSEFAEPLLSALRDHPLGREARIVGRVVAEHPGMATMRTLIGGERVVSMLSGEQLPRIC